MDRDYPQLCFQFQAFSLFFFSTATVDPVFCEQCIKNGSHGTIHTFKNYFATVFSVFSFQFQQNKFYPNRPLVSGFLLNKADIKIIFESNKIVLSKNGDFVGKEFCHEGLFVLEIDMEENIVKLIQETNILIRRLITMDFIMSSLGSCCYVILLIIFFFFKKKKKSNVDGI